MIVLHVCWVPSTSASNPEPSRGCQNLHASNETKSWLASIPLYLIRKVATIEDRGSYQRPNGSWLSPGGGTPSPRRRGRVSHYRLKLQKHSLQRRFAERAAKNSHPTDRFCEGDSQTLPTDSVKTRDRSYLCPAGAHTFLNPRARRRPRSPPATSEQRHRSGWPLQRWSPRFQEPSPSSRARSPKRESQWKKRPAPRRPSSS